jgi:hypothetical protein
MQTPVHIKHMLSYWDIPSAFHQIISQTKQGEKKLEFKIASIIWNSAKNTIVTFNSLTF